MDGSTSYDPEGAPLTYNWDFGDGSTLQTTEPIIEHTYKDSGIYTVTLIVNDGALDSALFTTHATVAAGGGGQRSDVDSFIIFLDPTEKKIDLEAGTTSYDVEVVYGETIDAETFEATINKEPFYGFTPVAGGREIVTIPLFPGRNVLKFQVDGTRSDGKTATDRDTLTFIVP